MLFVSSFFFTLFPTHVVFDNRRHHETVREIIYISSPSWRKERKFWSSGDDPDPPPCLKANEMIRFQADDPDTKKQITYMIKQGDTELFAIDQRTGVIKTTRGLDYERENQHILIIGTVENTSDLPGSTTRVVVNVQVSILDGISLAFFPLYAVECELNRSNLSYRIDKYIRIYVSLVNFACSFLF